jgi:hypothetical protein
MFKLTRTLSRNIHQWPPKKTVETIIKEAPLPTRFILDKKSKEFVSALAEEIVEKINKEIEKEKTFEEWNAANAPIPKSP